MRVVVGLLILIGGALGACFAVHGVLWQHWAITTFVEVPATILNSHVAVSRGSKSTTYTPEVTYSYVVDGKSYQSSQVLTFGYGTSDSAWARDIVNRYPPAKPARRGIEPGALIPNAKAYVDRLDPNDAFLVREYWFVPYIFSYITLFAIVVGLGMMFTDAFTTGRVKMEAVALDDSGWQLLLPKQNLKRRLRNAILWFVGTALIVVPLEVHWFIIAGQHSIGSVIGSALPLFLLVAFGVSVFRRWNVCRHMSDVRLRVKPAPLARGQSFSLDIEADAFAPLRVKSAIAKVMCIEHYKERRGNKTTYGTRKRGEKLVTLCGEKVVAVGEAVDGTGETLVAAGEMPPTSDLAVKLYPYYTWEVRLAVALEGAVDYAAVFPLAVE